MPERVGFIGLGIMGRGMAHNLLKAGFPLTVWNRTASKMDPLLAAGAQATSNPAAVAAGSDVVVICVSEAKDVEEVVLGPHGLVQGAKLGSLVVDCSTISPIATRQIADALVPYEITMVDAPVSGGSEGAAQGTLSIMVGGRDEDFNRALPILQAMGTRVVHVGACGAGQMVKMANQTLAVGNTLAMCEALLLLQAGGVELPKSIKAIRDGAAGSWMWSNRANQIIERDWRPGFTIDLQLKDIRMVLEAADAMGVPLMGMGMAGMLYRTLQAQGLGHEGHHALIKSLEHLAGYKVGSTSDDEVNG